MEEEEVGSVASGDDGNGSSDGGNKKSCSTKRRRGRGANKQQHHGGGGGTPANNHHHNRMDLESSGNNSSAIPPTPQTPQTPPAKRCDDNVTPLRPTQQQQQQHPLHSPYSSSGGGGNTSSPQHSSSSHHHTLSAGGGPFVSQLPRPPAAMTVIVRRCDLYDSGLHHEIHDCTDPLQPSHHQTHPTPPPHLEAPRPPILEYSYQPPNSSSNSALLHHPQHHHSLAGNGGVAVVRVPPEPRLAPSVAAAAAAAANEEDNNFWMQVSVMDKHSQPVPAHLPPHLSKYWYQRRRLFHKFDSGIQLDEESWFSVSPEQVADHVSAQVGRLLEQASYQSSTTTAPPFAPPSLGGPPLQIQQHVVLDAFCGCGGNAISFAKCLPDNTLVVAVDLDRTKLRMAAHNARIYGIPPSKITFVECNVLFLLEHVYRDGEFVLDRPCATPEAAQALMQAMPPPVTTELVQGYAVGGIDLLPRTVSCAHLDPPWGGVEYQVFGKNGYDLQRNMKIQRPSCPTFTTPAAPPGLTGNGGGTAAAADGALQNDFFDSFGPSAPSSGGARSRTERRAQFNADLDAESCVNGTELLALAASATLTRLVTYDVPRNVNRGSLGLAALAAGYRGNCQLEEQYLNGRLKTVTAYFGSDWRPLLTEEQPPHHSLPDRHPTM